MPNCLQYGYQSAHSPAACEIQYMKIKSFWTSNHIYVETFLSVYEWFLCVPWLASRWISYSYLSLNKFILSSLEFNMLSKSIHWVTITSYIHIWIYFTLYALFGLFGSIWNLPPLLLFTINIPQFYNQGSSPDPFIYFAWLSFCSKLIPFLKIFFKFLFIYLFIYGCVGSSFLCKGFL